MTARILQFPRNERILALGVIESMTFCTGHPPRPVKSRFWAQLGGYVLCLGIGFGALAMLVGALA